LARSCSVDIILGPRRSEITCDRGCDGWSAPAPAAGISRLLPRPAGPARPAEQGAQQRLVAHARPRPLGRAWNAPGTRRGDARSRCAAWWAGWLRRPSRVIATAAGSVGDGWAKNGGGFRRRAATTVRASASSRRRDGAVLRSCFQESFRVTEPAVPWG